MRSLDLSITVICNFSNWKKSDKNDIKIVGIENGFTKLNAQTKLEKYFIFLAENFFLDKRWKEDTNWEDYFLSNNKRLVVDLNVYKTIN